MTDPKIVVPFKPFVMQEGMTLEDVNNAPNLSAEAKKYIAIFDADGNGTFSKREADVYNATSISTTVFGTSLNTEYKNGEVKTTTIQGDIASLKYAPEGEVKPTEVPVENVVKNDKKEAETQSIPLQRTTKPRPLPPLTQVVGLDTLTFYSRQDSVKFNQENNKFYANFKITKAKEEAKWQETKAKEEAKWQEAKAKEEAKWQEAKKKTANLSEIERRNVLYGKGGAYDQKENALYGKGGAYDQKENALYGKGGAYDLYKEKSDSLETIHCSQVKKYQP